MVPSLLARTPAAASDPKPSRAEKMATRRIAETVYSICSYSPYDPFSVFKKTEYGIAGQPIRLLIMVHNIAMDTKDSLADGTYPEIAVVIELHRVDNNLTPIEGGGHKWLHSAFLQLSKAQARSLRLYADPQRSIGTMCQACNPVLSRVGF